MLELPSPWTVRISTQISALCSLSPVASWPVSDPFLAVVGPDLLVSLFVLG